MAGHDVVVLGIFVADLAFRAPRLPVMGETILGNGFAMGPGGKGSNQVIAAARAGGRAAIITRVGSDAFGEIARKAWAADGVDTGAVITDADAPTGAAFIFVSTETGNNAIIVESGAAARLTPADVAAADGLISGAKVFVTQFEQPIETAMAGLSAARRHGVTTVLNPAPALAVDDAIFALCDYVTPNETEAATLTGIAVESVADAEKAAADLVRRGARNALITLGEKGALLHGAAGTVHVPAIPVAKVVDTTGAGDAFNAGFCVALAEGRPRPRRSASAVCSRASPSRSPAPRRACRPAPRSRPRSPADERGDDAASVWRQRPDHAEGDRSRPLRRTPPRAHAHGPRRRPPRLRRQPPGRQHRQGDDLGPADRPVRLRHPRATEAILSLLPLDDFVDAPVTRMEVVGDPQGVVPVFGAMQRVIDRAEGRPVRMAALERFAFYAAARAAFAVVRTSDPGPYGCFLLKKGVVRLA